MTITLDDVACPRHLSIIGGLLDHSKIRHDEAVDMKVIYLGVDPIETLMQCENPEVHMPSFLNRRQCIKITWTWLNTSNAVIYMLATTRSVL